MTTKYQHITDIYSFLDTPIAPASVRLVADQEFGFKLLVELENGVEVLPIREDGKPIQWRTIEQAIGDLYEAQIDRSKVVLDISGWY